MCKMGLPLEASFLIGFQLLLQEFCDGIGLNIISPSTYYRKLNSLVSLYLTSFGVNKYIVNKVYPTVYDFWMREQAKALAEAQACNDAHKI